MINLPPVAILAGGLATRLHPITNMIPKSLVEVAGEPFVVHQLRLLHNHGINQVVMCVGFMGEMIQDFLGDGKDYGIVVHYSYDGDKLLGTAGALKKAKPLLGETFFVLYGDCYLECDYRAIYASFKNSGKAGLMTVFHNRNAWDASNIIFQNNQIVAYDKFNPSAQMTYIDYGLGILKSEVFDHLAEGESADLASVYASLIQNDQLAGYEVPNRFYEIGSLRGLKETEAYLKR